MPKDHLRAKHPKTGVEGYRVGLEVFHQLHCVNLLRQATFKDYYVELGTNGDFVEGEEMLRIHLGKSLAQWHAVGSELTYYKITASRSYG